MPSPALMKALDTCGDAGFLREKNPFGGPGKITPQKLKGLASAGETLAVKLPGNNAKKTGNIF
jgi:hypothetical protein